MAPDPADAPEPVPTKEQVYQTQWGTNYSYWNPEPIYDPIFHTRNAIAEHEHQVVQHQDGHVETTDGSDGPKGDWYMYGKPTAGAGAGGEWPQTHYINLVQVFQSEEDPEDIQVVQFENKGKGKWVELPDCDGSNGLGEKQLNDNLSNATVATCKKNPGVTATGKAQGAAAALDSMTPKAE